MTAPDKPAGRRWTWEHIVLVWLLAAGAAVASTLVRFPPGRPLRPVWPPPSSWLRAERGAPVVRALLRREPVLTAGWVVAPLGAALATALWVLRRPPPATRRGG